MMAVCSGAACSSHQQAKKPQLPKYSTWSHPRLVLKKYWSRARWARLAYAVYASETLLINRSMRPFTRVLGRLNGLNRRNTTHKHKWNDISSARCACALRASMLLASAGLSKNVYIPTLAVHDCRLVTPRRRMAKTDVRIWLKFKTLTNELTFES